MKRLTGLAAAVLVLVALILLVTRTGDTRRAQTPPANGEAITTTSLQSSRPQPAPASSPFAAAAPLPPPGAPATTLSPQSANPARPGRKRPWDPDYLAGLGDRVLGDAIRFELVAGEMAEGRIEHLEHRNNEVIYVSGKLSEPEQGRFFFQKQTMPGVSGSFVGVVELPASKRAFRIEPTANGGAELVEKPLGAVVCLRLPMPAEQGTNQVEEIPPLKPGDFPTVPIPQHQKGIIVLESLPGATAVLYLDFQGGYTPTWGGITYERPNVSNSQIRDVWVRVAEDYMPFRINVTTDLKVYQKAPENSRQRVVITPTTTAAPGAGGVAYIGSFDWTGDTPCWVFITSGQDCAEACSHEAGHTLGLGHDGQSNPGGSVEYYGGQGSGATAWGPIMGVSYGKPVSQWSKGEYQNANNKEDDLQIIATQNNSVTYRVDDTGSTLPTSRYLELMPTYSANGQGVMERTGDEDAFQFTTAGGSVTLTASPVTAGPNLAICVKLYDENNTLLASNSPQTVLTASVSTNLPAGTYTFRVTDAGRNNPVTTGFSSYGSLGYYAISGSVANGRLPDRFTIGERLPPGSVIGNIPVRIPTDHTLTFRIASGDPAGVFALNDSGLLSLSGSAVVDYETLARNTQLPVQYELFVDITDVVDGTASESRRRVVVAVTNVNEAPSITGFAASILEHTLPGTVIGTVQGSDPDFYTLLSYSIAAGNNNNMFSIDTQAGVISLAGDPDASVQPAYELTVVASDQTAPAPLMATSTVSIAVLPNASGLLPGSLSLTVYTNIAGNLVSALAGNGRFPNDPASEKQLTVFEMDSDQGDNYGAAARGYLLPPASGNYTFWIASDDNSELWLGTSTNPASRRLVAQITGEGSWASPRQWDKFTSQRSAPVALTGGQAYYIEARMKEGSGNDNLAVAWQCLENNITRDVIPGRFLAPYYLNYVPHPTGFTMNLHRDAIAGAKLGRVMVTDVNSNDTHSIIIAGGNTGGLFSIDQDTGTLRVSNENLLLTSGLSTYTLTVRATDNGTPVRSATASVTLKLVDTNAITATSIQQEIWNNMGSSTAISGLTGNARYPKRPDALRPLTGFDSGSRNYGDNYGSRIRAVVTPPAGGNFTFFLSSDDSSFLRLASATNGTGAAQIAVLNGYSDYEQWTKFASQKSGLINRPAGQPFYLEAAQKEGSGGDHLEVAWTGPGITGTNIIAASYLKPPDINFAPDLSGAISYLARSATNGIFVAKLTAIDSTLDTLAYKIVSGNEGDSFAINVDSGQITVADNTWFGTFGSSAFDLLIQAQDSGYGGLYPLRSAFATVRVQIVDDPPFIWSGGGADDNWSSSANWAGQAPADGRILLFRGTARQTNSNNLLGRVGPMVFETGGFSITGVPVELLGGMSATGDTTWSVASTLRWPQTFTNLSGTLTLAAPININNNPLTILANERVLAANSISGTGGLTKTGPGTLVLAAANTYTGPTLVSASTCIVSNPAALSATASIKIEDGAVLDVSPMPFVVEAGQSLAGDGQLVGPVTVRGNLYPGDPVGTFSFVGDLVLEGRTVLEITKTNSAISADGVRVSGAVRYGGLLLVSTSGDPLSLGDTVRIFDAASYTGEFSTVGLPALPSPLVWDRSRLGIDGTLRVVLPTGPQLVVAGIDAGNLVLQFAGFVGATYEVQWADSPLSTNWVIDRTWTGSNGIQALDFPVEFGTNRFFRVRAY